MEALGGRATTLTAMSHDDDASYKTLFSAPEVVRNLILGFIPDDWLHGLDYRTLERVRAATSPMTCVTGPTTSSGGCKWAGNGSTSTS